jgi:hypothetical protein
MTTRRAEIWSGKVNVLRRQKGFAKSTKNGFYET